jgi:hypothetical protein
VPITELSKGLPAQRKRNGSGCLAGVVMIVTYARSCSGRVFRWRKAGLAFQDLVAEMGLITSCPGSGSSVRQVSNASTTRGTDVLVDAQLNPPGSSLTVIMNSAQAGGVAAGVHPVGSELPVRQAVSGAAYLEIREVGPSEALVLVNRP